MGSNSKLQHIWLKSYSKASLRVAVSSLEAFVLVGSTRRVFGSLLARFRCKQRKRQATHDLLSHLFKCVEAGHIQRSARMCVAALIDFAACLQEMSGSKSVCKCCVEALFITSRSHQGLSHYSYAQYELN